MSRASPDTSDDTRWLQIKALFQQGLQLPAADRDAWLREQCGDDQGLLREVRGLLAAQGGAHGILEQGAAGALRQMSSDETTRDRCGECIGAYRLLRLVGEGGMGSVYLAEREGGDFRQRAALKLIRGDFLNDEARARFLRERRILAQLTHPHIAQLHDGGVAADGTPYFTLEYVEGESITRYCDARKLPIRERLRLVLQVCAAVAYAHRNLIVHRDLKPSNIFVTTDGAVKLLDFGIAKLLDAEGGGDTATQARLMTPEYASPEQVLGEPITTATDVYAIGVLLYELLSGHLPYARAEAGSISWSKAVLEELPEPVYRALARNTTRGDATAAQTTAAARGSALPALRRSLRGDLDRIVQRALAKPPEARYATVGALAADVGAWLSGNAISGGTRTYQLRKFMRRHWLPLSAAAVIVLILLGSAAAIVAQSRQIAREAQNTLQVKDFLYSLFTAVDPRESKGREVSAHELLDRGAQRIERDKTLDPLQRAEIEATLGRIYFQLSLYAQADKLQQSAIQTLASDPAQTAMLLRTQVERADTLVKLPDIETAAALAKEARRKVDATPNASAADRANVIHAQTIVALNQGEFDDVKHFADEELALARAQHGQDPTLEYRALMSLGQANWATSQFDQAEASYRRALEISERAAEPDELESAEARYNLAGILKIKLRHAEAQQLQEQALAADERIFGPDSRRALMVRRDLAMSHYYLGDYAGARKMFEQTLAAYRKSDPDNDGAIDAMRINLAILLTESGDPDAAEPILRELVSHIQKTLGDKILVKLAIAGMVDVHSAQGKLDQAQRELAEIFDPAQAGAGHAAGEILNRCRLGEIRRLRGDTKAAIELQRDAVEASAKGRGEANPVTAAAHQYLGLSLRDSGDRDGAAREFRAALASYAGYLPNAQHPLAATTRCDLAALLLERPETRDEGIRLLNEAADIRARFLGADDPHTRQAREALRRAQSPARAS